MSRQSIRQLSTSLVLEAKCIFCDKLNKYKGSSRTREPLIQCQEFRADVTVRRVATEKKDEHMLAIVSSQEMIAVEAHYHVTCYKNYTRNRPQKAAQSVDPDVDTYTTTEEEAYKQLFHYIRGEVIDKSKIVTVVELTAKLVQIMQDMNIETVLDKTKKHVRRKLELEFGSSIQIFPNEKGKLLLLPDNVSLIQLAIRTKQLEEQLEALRECYVNKNTVLKQAALHLRTDIQGLKESLSWPPQPSKLKEDAISIPSSVQQFLKYLLTGESNDSRVQSSKVSRY